MLVLIFISAISLKGRFYTYITDACLLIMAFITIGSLNLYILRKFSKWNRTNEYYSQILSSALNSDCQFYIIFDDQHKIIFQDSKLLLEATHLETPPKGNELESALELLNIKQTARTRIVEAISNDRPLAIKANIVIAAQNYKVNLIIEPFYVSNQKHNKNIFTPNNKYYILKGLKLYSGNDILDITNQIGCGYYEADEFGHIKDCNEIFAKTLGYSRKYLIDNLVTFSNFIESDYSLDANLSLNLGKSFSNGTWQGFATFTTKYKDQVHALIIQKSGFSDIGRSKKITGYLIKLPDRSLIIKARGIEEGWMDYSWQCFFADSPYPVAIVKKNGIINRTNNSLETLIDAPIKQGEFIDLFYPDDQAAIIAEMNKINLNPAEQPQPLQNIRLAEGSKKVDVYMGKIFDLNRNFYGFMARVSDVTQHKELEANLSHAQRMQTIGYLSGSIAHDFNNLLTAILGFSDVLLQKHTTGDPSFVHLMQIRQSANRASNLVNRLLAFSRRQTLKPQVLNLNEFFGEFYSIVKRLVGANIEVIQDVDPDLWYIKVDHVQFEQVVLNLVVNAHQAIIDSGRLAIRAQNISLKKDDAYLTNYVTPKGEVAAPPGDYICIEVEDNGVGIKNDIIDKIFEPFFSTKQDKSGTGLGLATVYGIVIQSGGHLYLKTKVGEGTIFRVLLPKHRLTKEETRALKNNIEIKDKKDCSGKGQIILVEDEEAVRVFAKHVLISKGYEVLDFASPIEAYEAIKTITTEIDLVITDVVMPGMSGPALIKQIKELYPTLKVIFISGYGEEAFNEEYGNSRDFNFLAKPFTLKELLLKVKEVLES